MPADDDGPHEVCIDARVVETRVDLVGVVEERLVVPPLLDIPAIGAGPEEHADLAAERHNNGVIPIGVAAGERERLAAGNVGVVDIDADAADGLPRPGFGHAPLDKGAGGDCEVLAGHVGGSDDDVGRAIEVDSPAGHAVPPLLPQVRGRLRDHLDAVGAAPNPDLKAACGVGIRTASRLTAEKSWAAPARTNEDVGNGTARFGDRAADDETGLEAGAVVLPLLGRRHGGP